MRSENVKPQKYKVKLSEKERAALKKILNEGTHTDKKVMRANILLEMDLFYYFKCERRPQDIVASRCGVSTTTVYNVSKQYANEGLYAAINRKTRKKPPVASIITGEKEAAIIALACSPPPEGNRRWTLRLLETQAVESGIIERISDTTIGRMLKKHNITLF